MTEVEDFIYEYEGEQRKVLLYFHHIFVNDLDLTGKMRYSIPFYFAHSWICYLNPNKKGGVELAFVRGKELSNSQGLLDAKDRKQVSGVEFRSVQDIPEAPIMEILLEAMLLDEAIPYASKNKKK